MRTTTTARVLALSLAAVFTIVPVANIGKCLLKQTERVGEWITVTASSALGSSKHVWDSHSHATHSANKLINKHIVINYFALMFSLFPQSSLTGILEHSIFPYRLSLEEDPQAISAEAAMVAVLQKSHRFESHQGV